MTIPTELDKLKNPIGYPMGLSVGSFPTELEEPYRLGPFFDPSTSGHDMLHGMKNQIVRLQSPGSIRKRNMPV